MKRQLITLIVLFLTINLHAQTNDAHSGQNIHKVEALEVLQTTNYTYILGKENGIEQWVAVPKMEAMVGEFYYYQEGMEMRDFKSTELDRTFSSILFLGSATSAGQMEKDKEDMNKPSAPQELASNDPIEPVNGGVSLTELLNNMEKYAGQEVLIRGKVVKYNSGIMGSNWLHIQDNVDNNDLTVTTSMEASVGDIIVLHGKITLNKDFGSGYFYDIIMEDAKIIE